MSEKSISCTNFWLVRKLLTDIRVLTPDFSLLTVTGSHKFPSSKTLILNQVLVKRIMVKKSDTDINGGVGVKVSYQTNGYNKPSYCYILSLPYL